MEKKYFIIRGGPDNGQKAELKYEINYKSNPIEIDLVAIKDKKERGRILGIAKPIDNNKFLMVLSFNGNRPEKIDNENLEQTLTLTKVE